MRFNPSDELISSIIGQTRLYIAGLSYLDMVDIEAIIKRNSGQSLANYAFTCIAIERSLPWDWRGKLGEWAKNADHHQIGRVLYSAQHYTGRSYVWCEWLEGRYFCWLDEDGQTIYLMVKQFKDETYSWNVYRKEKLINQGLVKGRWACMNMAEHAWYFS